MKLISRLLPLPALCVLISPQLGSAAEPGVVIHRRGENGCHTFRIPGLNRTKAGTLLAVYDMRYDSAKDLQGHMDIGLSRSTDGGRTWSVPKPVMDMGEYGGLPQDQNGCSDPNILIDAATGEIMVTALWSHAKPSSHQWRGKGSEPGFEIGKTAQFMMVRSTDDGQTWSAPENLTRQVKKEEWYLFAPAPGNGITMADGTLVIPSQGRDANGFPFSNITWSRDHGKTWTVSAPARDDTTESAVAELAPGTLLLNMRDNRNGKDKSDTNGRALSLTTDMGKTWTLHPADHGALPEPVCMGSMISNTLPNGKRVLFFSNPHNKLKRQEITIQASLDDGKSWPEAHRVLIDPGVSAGYSSMVMVDEKTLGILHESSEADLVFKRVPLADFKLPE